VLPALLCPAAALGGAGADKVARSTSANLPNTAVINRPVLVLVSAHGSASEQNCAFASAICLTMANRSKCAAREAVDARHRHHVGGREALEHFEKFAPVAGRVRHLLAVNLGAAYAA
jgi:hypothetical protein